jgi:hypothetical protein
MEKTRGSSKKATPLQLNQLQHDLRRPRHDMPISKPPKSPGAELEWLAMSSQADFSLYDINSAFPGLKGEVKLEPLFTSHKVLLRNAAPTAVPRYVFFLFRIFITTSLSPTPPRPANSEVHRTREVEWPLGSRHRSRPACPRLAYTATGAQ